MCPPVRNSGFLLVFQSSGLPLGALINSADNTEAKNLCIIPVKGVKRRLNRLPAAGVGDMVMGTVKKRPTRAQKGGSSSRSNSATKVIPEEKWYVS